MSLTYGSNNVFVGYKSGALNNTGSSNVFIGNQAGYSDASGINALKMLNDLPVVDFAYTKSPMAKHTGYIAQDAQKVLPEMVIYNEKEDTYATSATQLIPVLHKAILEQQKLIEAQSGKIAELEAAVNRLSGK